MWPRRLSALNRSLVIIDVQQSSYRARNSAHSLVVLWTGSVDSSRGGTDVASRWRRSWNVDTAGTRYTSCHTPRPQVPGHRHCRLEWRLVPGTQRRTVRLSRLQPSHLYQRGRQLGETDFIYLLRNTFIVTTVCFQCVLLVHLHHVTTCKWMYWSK